MDGSGEGDTSAARETRTVIVTLLGENAEIARNNSTRRNRESPILCGYMLPEIISAHAADSTWRPGRPVGYP